MASNDPAVKLNHQELRFQLINENIDIMPTYEESAQFGEDFTYLISTCIAERLVGHTPCATRSRIKDTILNRRTTKLFDAKAHASGKPTLLELATEEAKYHTLDNIKQDMTEYNRRLLEEVGKAYAEVIEAVENKMREFEGTIVQLKQGGAN